MLRGDIEKLRQLIQVKEFMNCMPEKLRVHLSDKKITTGYELAAVADEYIITYKRRRNRIVMKSQNDCGLKRVRDREKQVNSRIKEENRNTLRREDMAIICYRCGKVGHMTAKCQTAEDQRQAEYPQKSPRELLRLIWKETRLIANL